jgi:hypothetical protein
MRDRETADYGIHPATGNTDDANERHKRRRSHRIVIHTSPFLLCVQTSIAIGAGLAEAHGLDRPLSTQSAQSATFDNSPRFRPSIATEAPKLTQIRDHSSNVTTKDKHDDAQTSIKKATLRVDGFLGEWMTPDYFETITPPPGSVMMVAGAKADLLRREDYSILTHVSDSTKGQYQGFPGGWEGLSTAGALERGVYSPPVPGYAIPNSDPIPRGYVAHARDASINVDYQWDSMREPQNCGNGGEYGEEWSSMHKRFRRGFQQLLNFYRDQENSALLASKVVAEENFYGDYADAKEEDVDLVLILVTHGAGCNALIAALTNQPVLLDVGMASLTMAVRKEDPKSTTSSTPSSLSISDEYNIKLIANTEHLRASRFSSPTSSRTPSLIGGYNPRSLSTADSARSFINTDRSRSLGTKHNLGRVYSTASVATSFSEESAEEPRDDLVLDFGDVEILKQPLSKLEQSQEFSVD